MVWWDRFLKDKKADFPSQNSDDDVKKKKGTIHLREGTAEFELFMAQAELESGNNLAHGAKHLGYLLSFDPTNLEWLKLAEQYAQKAKSPIDANLLPVTDEQRYYATEALRAWFWQYEGRLNDAVDLLIQVTRAKSTPRYLDAWVLDWLEQQNAVESLSPETAEYLFGTVLNSFPEAKLSPYQQLQSAKRWAKLTEFLPPPSADKTAVRSMIDVGLLRKAGLLSEALAKAGALDEAKSWNDCIAIGLILKQMKRLPEAEDAFKAALNFDPEDVSARLEAADCWLENEQWENALSWYENVLKLDEKHPWALPSSWFCQWKITDDKTWIERIISEARTPKSNAAQRASQLWWLAFDHLPEPQDATANVVRQVRANYTENAPKQKAEKGGNIKLSLSSLEAPSNALAARMDLEALGLEEVNLLITVNEIPKPDPREAKEPVKWLLWKYEGTDAIQALPAPNADVVAHIEKLATMPYHPELNWAAASHVAHELGVQKAEEVLAVMIYPPNMPKNSHALSWLPRVQLSAMQVIAQLDTGWENSVRRKALLSTLFGPTDWTTQAAIIAMTWIAQNEPAHALDIHECFNRLENYQQEKGYTCWLGTLYQFWKDIPILFDEERKNLQEKLEALNEDNAD